MRSASEADCGVVAHDDGRAALGVRKLGEQVVEDARVAGIELARRLVGEQQPRPMRERGADGDALPLAAGELVGPGIALPGETDALEELVRPHEALAVAGRPAVRA